MVDALQGIRSCGYELLIFRLYDSPSYLILLQGKISWPERRAKKKEYKNEDYAKRQQKQWEKKGYKVTRRKNVLYLKKG